MVRRRIAAGIGLVGLAVGLMALPAVEASLPFTTQQLLILGVVVSLAGLVYVKPGTDTSEPSPPSPEGPGTLPEPGEGVEEQLDVLSKPAFSPDSIRHWKENYEELSDHLRSLAVSQLKDRYNLTAEEAETLIETGQWTEDPYATAFFTGADPNERSTLVPIRRRTGRSPLGKQASHVIDELGEIERGKRLLPEGALDGDDTPDAGSGADEQQHQGGGEAT